MLGDNPEKSKNPLKKAMRRRNAKTVQFTAPTYFEASDNDYSTEDEEDGEGEYFGQGQDDEAANAQAQEPDASTADNNTVEPLESSDQSVLNPQTAIDPRVDAPIQENGAEKAQITDESTEQLGMHKKTSYPHNVTNYGRRRYIWQIPQRDRPEYGFLFQGRRRGNAQD